MTLEQTFDQAGEMETLRVPEGTLTWEWEILDVPGVPPRQATDIRLNGEPVTPGVERQACVQAIAYRLRDR